MERILFVMALGLVQLLLTPGLLHAAAQCAPHDKVSAELASKFAEQPTSMGLAQDNTVMELYASDAGSWTLTATLPNGMTCLVASGHNFETVPIRQAVKGEPA